MKERDAYFDNLKFILILLVVVGHLIEPFNGEAAMGAIYQFIYSFHMPLFIFAVGYFAKCIQSPKQYVGLLSGLVVPYFIFETLYTLFDYYMQGLDRFDFTYFYPNWILWFLFSMMLWKMLLPYLLMLKYPLVVCFAMSIMLGYSIDVDYYASISRTLYFLPFFLIGYVFKREWLDIIKARPFQLLSIILLSAGFVLLYVISPILPTNWFYGAMPYLEFGLDSWYAGLYRMITYAFTVIMGLCVLSLIPRSDTPFTDRGVNTMYVFLLHGFIVKTMQHLGWFEAFRSTGGKLLLILLGAVITWLLSSSWIKRGFGWIVEPNVGFLFHYRSKHRHERVETKRSDAKRSDA
ncbi:acyltransferase family protein [Paenibacillus sp. Y412MC10]|uniref:acyltransferase family protein n=1 Tax=Geobacillus sp. (strain Y412MC10) TaxID=481743 RepID=UPI0001788FA8|nr:acyltransferase family protein [Paenibacillus sp. Y412MC10]ACX68025.1 acyltransferase 3 [Paenibacillus sp. Y412MC10]